MHVPSLRKDYFSKPLQSHSPTPSNSGGSLAMSSIQNSSSFDSNIGSGRTSEQGRDYLIELDGDLLSVYGHQSLKFLDRPWNRNRAAKASTVQFNFVSFDELIPYLSKFRITFPNVVHFEFVETGLHCLGQLNALASLQGMISLSIGEEGNPIFLKSDWRLYAIYRLEHWGLKYVNNEEIGEEDVIQANRTYGGLGELAILVNPPSQILSVMRKLDIISNATGNKEDLASLKDPLLKEIVAKESLYYKPSNRDENIQKRHLEIVENLAELGHSAFHKFGLLEDEWGEILPILVKRIVFQFSDIRQYKKESLGRLQKTEDK